MNNKEAGEQLAAIIDKHLEARRRSLNWLAYEIGMNYHTLRGQIRERPEKFGLFTAIKIEAALGIPRGELVFCQFAA